MASRCEVRVYARDEATARAWAEAAIGEVRRIERKFSRYRDDSVTAAINRSAGAAPVDVDDETAALLDFGARLHTASGGAFDLTSGVLRRAWDFRSGRVPAQHEIEALLTLIGWSKVEWERPRLRLPQPGMEIDFGGIGKEYAADRAAAAMQAHGARRGFVNLGGDVRAFGPQPDGRPWSIGIQHPRDPKDIIAWIRLSDQSVATSGDYEKFIMVDGRRYCHIIDPRTGWPVTTVRSATIITPEAWRADGLSTAVFVLGPEKGMELIESLPDVEGIIIDAEGRRSVSGGIKDKLKWLDEEK